MTTPENTASHLRAAADLLEHALAAIAESALRPIPIPTDAAATLNRCAEPIDYLRHHATPDYLQTGTKPPPAGQAAPAQGVHSTTIKQSIGGEAGVHV